MLSNIRAAENLISGDFVEFIKDGEGKLSCKKALELESIKAIVARDIAEGEMLSFDTNGDTEDLTTPQSNLTRVKRPTSRTEILIRFLGYQSRSSTPCGSRVVNKKNCH